MQAEIEVISCTIKEWVLKYDAHVYGQNLSKPSYISGLGKSSAKYYEENPADETSLVLFDTTNSELSSVGYGLGRLVSGHSSVLIVKQQDFLFLALDQLINTTCNFDFASAEGFFRIVCLVSDTGTEGTQAWANNLSLFSSLPPDVGVFYCYNSANFRELFISPTKNIEILFLSTAYTYSNSLLTNLSPIDRYSGVSIMEIKGSSRLSLLVGFISLTVVDKVSKDSTVIAISALLDPMVIDWIISYIAKEGYDNLTLYEASTSSLSVSKIIAFDLSQQLSDMKISLVDVRSIGQEGYSLSSQLYR